MTNATTCPKCDGTGTIRAFSHIANGDCFACGASGSVMARAAGSAGAARPIGKELAVDFGAGECFVLVMRFGAGFRADVVLGDRGCSVWFDVAGRSIVNVELSDGARGWLSAGSFSSAMGQRIR